MKRLIKKAGEWWDPQLPGVRSDKGEFAIIQDGNVLICSDTGEALRTLSFFQLGITNTSSEEQIKSVVFQALTFFLSSQ